MTEPSPTPVLDFLLRSEPDLVDRIFEYLIDAHPEIAGLKLDAARSAVRRELEGGQYYIAKRKRDDLARQVLSLFNGRNAAEVARKLNISRATVYRCLKQPLRE